MPSTHLLDDPSRTTTADPIQIAWPAALERLGDDPAIYAELARNFETEFEDEFEALQALLAADDGPGARSRLHTLRGVAANLGADDLAKHAGSLEAELEDGGVSEGELADFRRLLHESIVELRRVADRLEAEPRSAEPPAPVDSAEPDAAQRSRLSLDGPAKTRRVLVVDDQQTILRTIYQILRDDHEVILASSGQEALEVCRRQNVDLILLDLVMPEMDGFETCLRLKMESTSREIPIMFVTSKNRPDEEAHALRHGAVDFITKPLNPEVVRARVRTHLTLKAQADILKSLAFVDDLTGIGNRRLFADRLDMEWRSCRRNQLPLSVLMIDIDHFKRYNDRLGHQRGDRVLREVAKVLDGGLYRARDFMARYGGEEFVCLLPETGLSGARSKALSLLQSVENRRIRHPDSDHGPYLTVCIGVASCVPGPDDGASELLARADAQLYRAKAAGGNRVAVAGSEPTGIRETTCQDTQGLRPAAAPWLARDLGTAVPARER